MPSSLPARSIRGGGRLSISTTSVSRDADHDAGEAAERQLRATALGSLFMAGATIGLVSVLLPHSARADDVGLDSNIAAAYVGGLLLLAFGTHLRLWVIHASLIAGSLLITRAILLSGEHASFYTVWYVWVGVYAFYFFGRRGAAAHVVLVAALYAFTLHQTGPNSPVGRWLTIVSTLLVAGVFIETLSRRARGEAAAAQISAHTMAMAAQIAHQLATVGDWKQARAHLCEAAAQVTGAVSVTLWEPTDDATALRVTAAFGRQPDCEQLNVADPHPGVVKAVASRVPVAAVGGHKVRQLGAELGSEQSTLGARWEPIVHDGRAIAVLAFYWAASEPAASSTIHTVTDLLAAEAATTLERVGLLVRLERLAQTDELTGLPNRRAWQGQLPREVERARRNGHPLCVAMLDLDHFKRYNDGAGHLAGDRLLKEVATAWNSHLRATDVLARYGGEEFAVALPGCPEQLALEVIKRVCLSTPGGQECSGGIAQWDGLETATELLERADRALYEAKRLGRNQIRLAQPRHALLGLR